MTDVPAPPTDSPVSQLAGLRRRPSGEPPPLPKHLDRGTLVWLLFAAALSLVWLVLVSDDAIAHAISVAEGNFVISVASHRTTAMTDVVSAVYDFLFTWLVPIVGWTVIIVTLLYRRLRALVVFFVSLLAVLAAGGLMAWFIQRPRPYAVEIVGRWSGWAQPHRPLAMGAAVLVGAYCALVPKGRLRTVFPFLVALFLLLYGSMAVYLGVAHPTDVFAALVVGGAIPLAMFRWFAPEDVFPISYRKGGNTAHLDVGGERGAAIRAAVEEQLGVTVVDVKPIGGEGSAGSTPILLTLKDPVTGEPVPTRFAKLLARSHLRSDRQYKLMRTLAYGRLEDETKFGTVRRLAQQEDYLGLRFEAAGIHVPKSYGLVEITPEAEYMLVTDFLDGYKEIGEAEVSDVVIDNALMIVRHMWDAGLAHRDIKPANLMTKGDDVAVIDVGFSQVRPTPWRQAIDLANMMIVLALRRDPDTVYQRALRYFTADDIAEAFAATRGITVPTQSRQYLKADGRSIIEDFRRLAPDRAPIKIQQWSARRIGLAFAVVGGGVVLLTFLIANLQTIGLLPT